MRIEISPDRELVIKEVFSGVLLISDSGEEMGICMRDSGFEFTYAGAYYEAKTGKLSRLDQAKKTKEDQNDPHNY